MCKENKWWPKLYCNNQKIMTFIETMTFIERKKRNERFFYWMWPSATWRSMGLWTVSDAGWCRDDLAPLIDMIDALRRAKPRQQRIQFPFFLYGTPSCHLSQMQASYKTLRLYPCHLLMTLPVGECGMFNFLHTLLILPFLARVFYIQMLVGHINLIGH